MRLLRRLPAFKEGRGRFGEAGLRLRHHSTGRRWPLVACRFEKFRISIFSYFPAPQKTSPNFWGARTEILKLLFYLFSLQL
jgi:hypothetical protein